MSRRIAALVIMGMPLGLGSAHAQNSNAEPVAVEVTFMPGGAAYFTSKGDKPSFGNYGYGAADPLGALRQQRPDSPVASSEL